MSDLRFSITDDGDGETLAEDLTREEAIRRLFHLAEPLHWFSVHAWETKVVDEDGTHPIVWTKNAEVFLHDVYEVPVSATPVNIPILSLLEAAKEALECIPDLEFPPGAPESDDPLYEGLREASRYTEAVRARLNAVLDVLGTDEKRVVSVRSLRQLLIDRIQAITLGQTQSERERMFEVLDGQCRANVPNPYRHALKSGDFRGLGFPQLGTLVEAIEAAQEPSADDSTDSLTQTTQDNGER